MNDLRVVIYFAVAIWTTVLGQVGVYWWYGIVL